MTNEPLTFGYAGEEGRPPWWSRIFGVSPRRSAVTIVGRDLVATFGPWTVRTPIENIRDVDVEGPYAWWKVAGPARYSISDKSLTFATSTRRGVAISFVHPVAGLDPLGVARHPSLTVTVDDPEALVAALVRASQGDEGDR